jgi:Family of unknown function (DUF5330)
MMFLLRTAFWVCVALALLPSFVPQRGTTVTSDLAATDAVNAASATFADMSRLCERRPDACAAGGDFAVAFGRRTREGAKIVYALVTGLAKPDRAEVPDRADPAPRAPAATTGVADAAPAIAAPASKPSQNTLTAADALPAWRAPRPHRETGAKRPT